MNQPSQVGFFAALFDFSFSEFIIPRIASIAYIIALVGGGLWALRTVVVAFQGSFLDGVLFLVAAVVWFLLYAIGFRVILEAAVALTRIAQNTTDLLRNQNPPPPTP